jgi:NADH:ubiquinone oxidoreductase subunit K
VTMSLANFSPLALSLYPVGLTHFLLLGAVLLVCGVLAILTKRNAIGILMGVELILNAANINLVAFDHFANVAAGGAAIGQFGRHAPDGQIIALFVIVLAAAEAAVALAIFLNFYNNFASIDVERADELRG